MLGIAIHCIQHSQAMLERGVCELAHSFFHSSSVETLRESHGNQYASSPTTGPALSISLCECSRGRVFRFVRSGSPASRNPRVYPSSVGQGDLQSLSISSLENVCLWTILCIIYFKDRTKRKRYKIGCYLFPQPLLNCKIVTWLEGLKARLASPCHYGQSQCLNNGQ